MVMAAVSKTAERKPWGFDSLPFRSQIVNHAFRAERSGTGLPSLTGGFDSRGMLSGIG